MRNGPVMGRTLPLGEADRYLAAVVVAWLVWVATSLIWSGRPLPLLSPYLIAPILLLGGIVAGRLLASRRAGWLLPALAAMLALAVLVAIPFYANAQAALGVQLVALAGLLLLADPTGARNSPRAASLVVLTVIVAVLGVLLAARSQAAIIIVVPVAILTAAAVTRGTGPPRRRVGLTGLVAVGLAAVVVISFGSLSMWPRAMNAGESLSSTRHALWSDALDLWRAHPVTGAGPGSFLEHSTLAASDPALATAHSSILQVGSELGIVGAVLFLGMLIAGAAVAIQGPRPQALIAMAAWSALAVHSMIDHLYEFPVVTIVAGIVLGWGGKPSAAEEDG